MAISKLKGLTIEIGGDTTKLTSALKETEKESTDLQSKLKSVNQMLKFDPSNVELLAQKQQLVSEQIEATKSKLQTLKTAQQQYIDGGGDLGSKQYIALQQEIQITENKLKSLSKEQTSLNANIQAMGAKFTEAGEKLTSMGKTASKVSAVVAGIGAGSYKAWTEVDESLDSVAAGTGATGKALEKLQDVATEVYTSMPVDIATTGTAVADLNTRLGLQGDELEEATEQFMKYAEVNGTDVQSSIESVSKAMQDANIPTSELNDVLDMLTTASQQSGLSVDAIASSLSSTGVQMRELGFSTEETIALLATMEKNGVNSQTVMAGMKKAMANYANEGKNASEELANLWQGIKDGTVTSADAIDVFGTKSGAAIYEYVKEGKLDYQDLLSTIQDSNGQLDASYEAMLDPTDKFKTALNNLKQVGYEIWDQVQATLAPMLEVLVQKLKEFSDWFTNLDPNMQQAIVVIGMIVGAIGPLLIVVGKISTGVGAVISTISKLSGVFSTAISIISTGAKALFAIIEANPVIAIITAIIAIVVLLYTKCEWFRDGVNAIFTAIKDFFVSIWDNIKSIWEGGIDGLTQKISSWFDSVKNGFSDVLNSIVGFLSNIISKIGEWASNLVSSGANAISNFASTLVNGLKALPSQFVKWGADMIDGFIKGIKSKISAVTNVISGIGNKIKSFLHFSRPDEGPLRDYEAWMPDFMQGLANGIDSNAYKVTDALQALTSDMSVNNFTTQDVNKVLTSNATTTVNLRVISELDGKQVADSVTRSITRSSNSRMAFKGV